MAKRHKKLPWWSPSKWVEKLLPGGHWSSRRQFMMNALVVLGVGWLYRSSPSPQPPLQSAPSTPPVQGYSEGWPGGRLRVVATATATNTNSPSFITPPFGPLKARDPLP